MTKNPRPEALCPTCNRPYNVVRGDGGWRMIRHPNANLFARGYCDGGTVPVEKVIAWVESRKKDATEAVRGFVTSMNAANAAHERRVAEIREKLTADRAEEKAYERLIDTLRTGK